MGDMEIKPYFDRLVAGVKNAIVDFITLAVGFFIAGVVASHWHPRYGAYWFLTMFMVFIACMIVIRLLQHAWARYRGSPN